MGRGFKDFEPGERRLRIVEIEEVFHPERGWTEGERKERVHYRRAVAHGDNVVVCNGFSGGKVPDRIREAGDIIDVPYGTSVQVSAKYDTVANGKTSPVFIHGPALARVTRYSPGNAHTFARITLVLVSPTGRIEGGNPFLELW